VACQPLEHLPGSVVTGTLPNRYAWRATPPSAGRERRGGALAHLQGGGLHLDATAVPPVDEGLITRPDTVPGLDAVLVPGAVVALVPGRDAAGRATSRRRRGNSSPSRLRPDALLRPALEMVPVRSR